MFVDDSRVNLEDLSNAGVYAIAVNGSEKFEEGYSNLTQAVAVERILYRRALQNR